MISMSIVKGGELRNTLSAVQRHVDNTRPLMADLGKTTEVVLVGHFRERNKEPKKDEKRRDWPKRNFWENEGAKKTLLTSVTATEAVVSIASPAIAHKLKGGTITPKRGKALAIPLTPEAYAAGSPRELDDQDELFVPKGTHVLAKKKGDGIEAMYILVPRVDQAPDPDTLPDMDKVANGPLNDVAEAFLVKAVQSGNLT